ncbi:MAG: HIT domain-containing protein [Jatrophihabitans sp.]
MADGCLFCSMIDGSIPVDFVYSDESAIAIADINPQAPTHLLLIPRSHVVSIGEIGADPQASAGWLAAIRAVVAQEALTDYRTVCNTGAESGQSVFHLHAHVLAGRPFSWPPG